ncbi:MAG: hypothetical protein F6K09_00570 [Merismopedia sp. SIO2A8]|nr:hypothetical protein [Symploca sp. SIO2B6]NET47253.1 hypothetical protein [Merismopedia sp. SIO2A8]
MFYSLRSLLLTSIFGFTVPLMVIVSLLMALVGIGWIPWLQPISTNGIDVSMHVLQTFGNGSAVSGGLVIASVSGIVALLFNALNLFVLAKPIR